ncbi:hypothetical protein [Companilactobacillus nuruki]|uniref:Immunity protein n=1 Tax=Companilactobacillus nuruki TaxID=1993540 RepID=A0A2N7ATJ9_9LACO|nr:hypothetical protein [Companilactobacillus nuruki]PMD69509.1 hypothetical protein CBP76_07990 [Companilactobacillus nuruki]
MNLILGLGSILLGIWQIHASKKYFDNLKKQTGPLLFSLIAVTVSLIVAAFLLIYGVSLLVNVR